MDIKELYNILLSYTPRDDLLRSEKELFELIPELEKCKGFKQNNDWHMYDVYEHILHVVDNTPSNLILRLAALFHDIGKPITYKEDKDGIGHFYGHWEVSQQIFDSFASKHKVYKNMSKMVSNLIYYHDLNIDELNDSSLLTMYNKLGLQGIVMLYQLKTADLQAQNDKYQYLLKDYEKQKEKILLKVKK